ncbi:MAG: glycerophosphodiester phosphodiesterase family protein [Bacillaceae bacterium]
MIIWIIIIFLFAWMYLYCIKGERIENRKCDWFLNRSFAHRGLVYNDISIPENSLLAFETAKNKGYGIELDVILTKDDKLVVFHDDCLERMTTIKKKVWDCTYEELNRCPLKDSGQFIPLLSDVLTMVDGKVPIIVEIKTMKNRNKLCESVLNQIINYNGPICVESFDPLIVRWFKRHARNVIRGQISMRYQDEGNLSFIMKFLLENMMFNFLSRPHFISYSYPDRDKLCFQINRLLRYPTIGWTIRSDKEITNGMKCFDSVIFEYCQPPEEWVNGLAKNRGINDDKNGI